LLQHDETTQDKTHVYAFGDRLKFTKTYFCQIRDSGSPETKQATHKHKCQYQKSLDLSMLTK
jgi:hypothetical protein